MSVKKKDAFFEGKDVLTKKALGELLEDDVIDDVIYIDQNGYYHDLYKLFDRQEIPFCCGVIEIGELEDINIMTQKSFNVLMSALVSDKRTYLINTNGVSKSVSWEEKLAKNTKFKLIKKFDNPNSKNTISVWISK